MFQMYVYKQRYFVFKYVTNITIKFIKNNNSDHILFSYSFIIKNSMKIVFIAFTDKPIHFMSSLRMKS